MSHYNHSRLVAGLRVKEVVNMFDSAVMNWPHGPSHALQSPHEGYMVRMTFSEFLGHPEYIRIRSTNWRTEDEPNAIITKEQARAIYRKLKQAGFVAVPKVEG